MSLAFVFGISLRAACALLPVTQQREEASMRKKGWHAELGRTPPKNTELHPAMGPGETEQDCSA